MRVSRDKHFTRSSSTEKRNGSAEDKIVANSLLSGFRGLLMPQRCVSCSRQCNASPIPVCRTCLSELDSPSATELRACLEAGIPSCRVDLVMSLWYYDRIGPVRILHRHIKYGEGYRLGILMGEMIGRSMAEQFSGSGHSAPTAIVPIPVHEVRRKERGYNQSGLLAHGMGRVLDIPVRPEILKRCTLSGSQVGLGRELRSQNLSTAFVAKSGRELDGGHVVVVDDVMTTGTTLRAAVNVLLASTTLTISTATLAFVRP